MKNLLDNVNKLMGMHVRVYRNLHKHCFSVQAKNAKGNWVVVAHVTQLQLRDVEFRVSKAGRERVLRERAKNVHAYVYGVVDHVNVGNIPVYADYVNYNPYTADHFWWANKVGLKATRADMAWLHGAGRNVVAAR